MTVTPKSIKPSDNTHAYREPWLMDAVAALRTYFAQADLTIPDQLRCGFGLNTSGKKSSRKGECWPASASADGHVEIFVSPDIAEPAEVLATLVYCLIHACMPNDAGHGPKYKAAAASIGLIGKMRRPTATAAFGELLSKVAEGLGPLPHAKLDILQPVLDRPQRPLGAPKKQSVRMLKAECQGKTGKPCGYTVRLAGKWVTDLGPPHCPKHGAMKVEQRQADQSGDEEPGEVEGV